MTPNQLVGIGIGSNPTTTRTEAKDLNWASQETLQHQVQMRMSVMSWGVIWICKANQ